MNSMIDLGPEWKAWAGRCIVNRLALDPAGSRTVLAGRKRGGRGRRVCVHAVLRRGGTLQLPRLCRRLLAGACALCAVIRPCRLPAPQPGTHHSVATLLLAMADPQPKVLKQLSTMLPFSSTWVGGEEAEERRRCAAGGANKQAACGAADHSPALHSA